MKLDDVADVVILALQEQVSPKASVFVVIAALAAVQVRLCETSMSMLAEASNATCVWQENEDGMWRTGCGNTEMINEKASAENRYHFCAHCGKPLEERRYCPVDP